MITIKQLTALEEQQAFDYYTRAGYKILLRAYECPLGTFDLVMKKDGVLYFASVFDKKKITKVVNYYLKRYGIKDVPFEIIQILTPARAKEVNQL